MLNKVLNFTQDKCEYLYENSIILQNINNIILLSIIATFIVATFANTEIIGLFALLTFFLTLIKLITKKGLKLSCNKFEIFLLAYFMVVVISLFGSTLFALSLKGFIKTVTYLLFYSSVVLYAKDNKDKIPLLFLVIGACISFESITAIFQNFFGLEEISSWQDKSSLNPEEIMNRVYGTLQPLNPNLLGGYLIVGLPVLISYSLIKYNNKQNNLAIASAICVLFCIIAIILTGCRGAYIALFTIFVNYMLLLAKFIWKKHKKTFLATLGSMCGAIMIFILTFAPLKARLLSIFSMRNDSSNSFRFNVYHSSLNMFKDNWLLGIGCGNKNFREIYGLYMKTGFDALSTYNVFLEIAVESGIFALIAFLGFVGILLTKAVKTIFNSTNINEILIISAVAISIFAAMIHGLVDTVFFRPQIQLTFWALVAFASASLNFENK